MSMVVALSKIGSNFWRYTWDYENRLATASTRKQTVRYAYDALGRRVRRNLAGGKESTKFIYDDLDVVADDNSGVLTKYQNSLAIDEKLKVTTNNSSKYFLPDHLGSTFGLANSSGLLSEQNSYDSFGNSTNSGFSSRYQFTGREFDGFSQLQYSRARFYDPSLGRFISEDPIGFYGGFNLYAYVGNRPMFFTDPSGQFPSWGPVNYHAGITRSALQGLATPDQIEAMSNANTEYDRRTQDPIYAPYHAMTRPGQSIDDARAEANEFVRRKICAARQFAAQGNEGAAMTAMGEANHTLQDNESPAHSGFKPAWPSGWHINMIMYPPHVILETIPWPSRWNAAENATRQAWKYYKGEAMPSNFFPNSNDRVVSCDCK